MNAFSISCAPTSVLHWFSKGACVRLRVRIIVLLAAIVAICHSIHHHHHHPYWVKVLQGIDRLKKWGRKCYQLVWMFNRPRKSSGCGELCEVSLDGMRAYHPFEPVDAIVRQEKKHNTHLLLFPCILVVVVVVEQRTFHHARLKPCHYTAQQRNDKIFWGNCFEIHSRPHNTCSVFESSEGATMNCCHIIKVKMQNVYMRNSNSLYPPSPLSTFHVAGFCQKLDETVWRHFDMHNLININNPLCPSLPIRQCSVRVYHAYPCSNLWTPLIFLGHEIEFTRSVTLSKKYYFKADTLRSAPFHC